MVSREVDGTARTARARLIACGRARARLIACWRVSRVRSEERWSDGGSDGGGGGRGRGGSSVGCSSSRSTLAICSSAILGGSGGDGGVAGAPEIDEVGAAWLLHQEGVGGLCVLCDIIAEPFDGVVRLATCLLLSDDSFHLEVLA